MIDIEELLDEYRRSTTVRYGSSGVFVTPPFYHINNDESIALRFSEAEDGRPVISDCGTTMDRLELMDVRLKDHRERLNAIKERFCIEEKDGAFFMKVPTTSLEHVIMHIGYFLQAITLIANIDL